MEARKGKDNSKKKYVLISLRIICSTECVLVCARSCSLCWCNLYVLHTSITRIYSICTNCIITTDELVSRLLVFFFTFYFHTVNRDNKPIDMLNRSKAKKKRKNTQVKCTCHSMRIDREKNEKKNTDAQPSHITIHHEFRVHIFVLLLWFSVGIAQLSHPKKKTLNFVTVFSWNSSTVENRCHRSYSKRVRMMSDDETPISVLLLFRIEFIFTATKMLEMITCCRCCYTIRAQWIIFVSDIKFVCVSERVWACGEFPWELNRNKTNAKQIALP